MRSDPKIMKNYLKVMLLGWPEYYGIDPKFMKSDPKCMTSDPKVMRSNLKIRQNKATNSKITLLASLGENRDIKTVIREPFANNLALFFKTVNCPFKCSMKLILHLYHTYTRADVLVGQSICLYPIQKWINLLPSLIINVSWPYIKYSEYLIYGPDSKL